MKAAVMESYNSPFNITTVPDPEPGPHSVVVRVMANGICRSDWHVWVGHDDEIELPHVLGHEMAGIVETVGKQVTQWKPGERITTPFVCGCGTCLQCLSGNHQVCDHAEEIGFTRAGSFGEYCEIPNADINGVHLPEEIEFISAASMGCRFVTANRAVVSRGRVRPGEWVAIHGCGGVGLSAIMIANAAGARVIGVDINPEALDLVMSLGAAATINSKQVHSVAGAIAEITGGGADVSIDALGKTVTFNNSILCLKKRGRHVQIGQLVGDDENPAISMEDVLYKELEVIGSYGMQAYRYPKLFQQILSGKLNPKKLVTHTVSLDEVSNVLQSMSQDANVGISVWDGTL